MKKLIASVAVIVLLAGVAVQPVFLSGCASTRQLSDTGVYAGDRVLFTAEAVTPTTFKFVNDFLAFETRNRTELWTLSHDIKHFADKLRAEFPAQKQRADELHDIYAATKAEGDRVKLADIIRILENITIEIISYQAEAAQRGIK